MRAKLWAIREAKGWKHQQQLIDYFGVGQSTVSRWLSGKSQPQGSHRDAINALYAEISDRDPGRDKTGLLDQMNAQFQRLPKDKQLMAIGLIQALLMVIASW